MCERVRGVHRQGWRLGWWGGGGAVDWGVGVKGKTTAACGHKGGGGGSSCTLNSNGVLQLCPASVSRELHWCARGELCYGAVTFWSRVPPESSLPAAAAAACTSSFAGCLTVRLW